MPKCKQQNQNGQATKNAQVPFQVDVNRSISDNLKERYQYWESAQKQMDQKRSLIKSLEDKLIKIKDNPENRKQRADIRIQIEDENRKLIALKTESDQVGFLSCIAKIIQEENTVKPVEQNDSSTSTSTESKGGNSEMYISVLGPIRPRLKRKKVNKPSLCGKTTMVVSKSIESFVSGKIGGPQVDSCKRLAQEMGEIPIDISEFEYCPRCPDRVIMEYIEKPPSYCCPLCGVCRETLDVNSALVHDKVFMILIVTHAFQKETPVHVPFTYRPKQHFVAWIRRVTGELSYTISGLVIDRIRLELYNRRIYDVNEVTWDVVDRILRKLAKKVDRKYNIYYQHVYQITNIIRGAPILTLSDAQKQKLHDMFDVIYAGWERHKTDERSNFMSNAFVLQMCFRILGYPEKIVNMFNMLKGNDNLKEYDRICEIICKENDWPFVRSSAISDFKYSGGRNVFDMMKKKEPEANLDNNGNNSNNNSNVSLSSKMQKFLPNSPKPPTLANKMKQFVPTKTLVRPS